MSDGQRFPATMGRAVLLVSVGYREITVVCSGPRWKHSCIAMMLVGRNNGGHNAKD